MKMIIITALAAPLINGISRPSVVRGVPSRRVKASSTPQRPRIGMHRALPGSSVAHTHVEQDGSGLAGRGSAGWGEILEADRGCVIVSTAATGEALAECGLARASARHGLRSPFDIAGRPLDG